MLAVARCWERGCIHYQGVEQSDGTEATEVHVCAAFPDGIPEEILEGDDLHLEERGDEVDETIFEIDPELSQDELMQRRFGDLI